MTEKLEQQFFTFSIDWRVKSERRKSKKHKRNDGKNHHELTSLFTFLAFSLSPPVVERISQVRLRNLFPFLWRDQIEGRAKRKVKSQLEPQLLNSYQGHLKSITGLIFSEPNQVLISSSVDKSVRLWSLSGQVNINFSSPKTVTLFTQASYNLFLSTLAQ